MVEAVEGLDELVKETLQEIMNIAFGRAAADLAEVMRLYVTLNVPKIDVLSARDARRAIGQLGDGAEMGLVTQSFSGKPHGTAFLLFPDGDGRKLLSLFEAEVAPDADAHEIDALARDSLLEVGNILIGVCVGKVSELLKGRVQYSPPRLHRGDLIDGALYDAFAGRGSFAVLFQTRFSFEEAEMTGFLFLVIDSQALDWLREAVGGYLEAFV